MSSVKKRITLQPKDKKEFIAEKIISRRKRNRKLYYLIKWQGFDESKNSWELAEHLDCHEMMRVYEENRKIEFRKRLSLRQYKSRKPKIKDEQEDTVDSEVNSTADETDKENSEGNKTELKKSLKFETQISKQKETENNAILQKDKAIKEAEKEAIIENSANLELTAKSDTEKQQQTSNANENEIEKVIDDLNTTERNVPEAELPTAEATENNDKECLEENSNKKSYEFINGRYLVTDFHNRDSVQTGFDRGLQVESILGATKVKGILYLVVKFLEDDEPQLIVSEVANKKIPQMVIKFYESCLTWDSDDEDMKK